MARCPGRSNALFVGRHAYCVSRSSLKARNGTQVPLVTVWSAPVGHREELAGIGVEDEEQVCPDVTVREQVPRRHGAEAILATSRWPEAYVEQLPELQPSVFRSNVEPFVSYPVLALLGVEKRPEQPRGAPRPAILDDPACGAL